jgi:hypothetical protein
LTILIAHQSSRGWGVVPYNMASAHEEAPQTSTNKRNNKRIGIDTTLRGGKKKKKKRLKLF